MVFSGIKHTGVGVSMWYFPELLLLNQDLQDFQDYRHRRWWGWRRFNGNEYLLSAIRRYDDRSGEKSGNESII